MDQHGKKGQSVRSTRSLSVIRQADATVIRYRRCPASVRYLLMLFVPLAVTILVTEHGWHVRSPRIAVELALAGLMLTLVLILAISTTEVTVTRDQAQVRCLPVAIVPQRTFRRSEIIAIHHWEHRHKGVRHRVAIQLESPVHLGSFETRDEARSAAEAIAAQLQVECREAPPG